MIFQTDAKIRIVQNSPMGKKDYSEIVLDWLANAMDEGKVSQSELGRRTPSLDQPKISQIVRRKRELSAAELLEIAIALNVGLPTLDDQAANDAEDNPATQDDLSQLAVDAVKKLAVAKFHGDITDESYIEATAIVLAALMQTGKWNPKVFEAASEIVTKISGEREEGEFSFKEYIKSVAISYVKMVGAKEYF